jgi:hypothetical protein
MNKNKEELRLYSFVNMYLSPIQAGIQTGHMTDNMTVKYLLHQSGNDEAQCKYVNWILNHKTYIVLNGGDSDMMYEELLLFNALCIQLNLPFAQFNEPGVGNVLTCYGAVIPERLFNVKYIPEDDSYVTLYDVEFGETNAWCADTSEYQLIKMIKSKSLFK